MKARRYRLAAGLVALAGLAGSVAVVSSAPAQQSASAAAAQAEGAVKGSFSLVMMVHTSSSSAGPLPGANAWNGTYRAGVGFRYRSIPCSGNAPVNNLASDLPSYGARVAGSRVPSSMRAHPFGFRVRQYKGRWEMQGAVTFTVCKLGAGPTPANDPVPDEAKPKIRMGFRVQFKRENTELVRWTGRFRIEGGTGRYEGLTGNGQISGYFACFGDAGCGTGGTYTDGQMVLSGTYSDPTPQLGA